MRELEERTLAAGTDWALGILARSRALLSAGEAADALYLEAIERLGRSRIVVHLARAHLLYGEWLRRENRRLDARDQLRTAYDMLHRIGADAFAERARRELVATGETVRKRSVETRDDAHRARATDRPARRQTVRRTRRSAATVHQPRTVEWHLGKVFTKLGIAPAELRAALNARRAGTRTAISSRCEASSCGPAPRPVDGSSLVDIPHRGGSPPGATTVPSAADPGTAEKAASTIRPCTRGPD